VFTSVNVTDQGVPQACKHSIKYYHSIQRHVNSECC